MKIYTYERRKIKNFRSLNDDLKMEANKILALDLEPFCVAFKSTETVQTQKTVTGLRVRTSTVTVRTLSLATVTVRTLIWAFERQGKFKNFH